MSKLKKFFQFSFEPRPRPRNYCLVCAGAAGGGRDAQVQLDPADLAHVRGDGRQLRPPRGHPALPQRAERQPRPPRRGQRHPQARPLGAECKGWNRHRWK